MANHVVNFAPRARADLSALSPEVARRILRKILELQESPAPRGDTIKRLTGFQRPYFRLRVGDWRVVFRLEGAAVFILLVTHHSELDRELRTLL